MNIPSIPLGQNHVGLDDIETGCLTLLLKVYIRHSNMFPLEHLVFPRMQSVKKYVRSLERRRFKCVFTLRPS